MVNTNWRVIELEHYANDISWLTADEAFRAYSLATLYAAKTYYGLDTSTVAEVERITFENDMSEAKEWLGAHLNAAEQLVVVFDETNCFRCDAEFFLKNWQDVFVPSRDDAVIYSIVSPLVLFYCHENELEAGQRIVYG
jgi:hypothetical protein